MKYIVLDDGTQLTSEEAITHLLREVRELKSQCSENGALIESLLVQFNYLEKHYDTPEPIN